MNTRKTNKGGYAPDIKRHYEPTVTTRINHLMDEREIDNWWGDDDGDEAQTRKITKNKS